MNITLDKVSERHSKVLQYLTEKGPKTCKEIAAICNITPCNMNSTLKTLQKQGAIHRVLIPIKFDTLNENGVERIYLRNLIHYIVNEEKCDNTINTPPSIATKAIVNEEPSELQKIKANNLVLTAALISISRRLKKGESIESVFIDIGNNIELTLA